MSSPLARKVMEEFGGIIDVLRYHIAAGRFSYVDRIMSAMDYPVVEETVREAVRAALSAANSPRTGVGRELRYDAEKGRYVVGSQVKVAYVEKEEIGGDPTKGDPIPTRVYLHARVLKTEEGVVAFFTPPRIPSEEEMAKFFDAIRRDLEVAKIVASLAMTVPRRRGRGEER